MYRLPPVTVVHNVPVFRQDAPARSLREYFGLGQDVRLVVYVGLVTFNRGLEQLVAAIQQLPRFTMITVGRWREDIRARLVKAVQSSEMRGRFFMHPQVPPTHVSRLISEADVSVVPIQNACLSYYYCMPNKLFESAVAGVPVVASDFPDMRKFIEDNNIGVVCDASNPDAIAQAIVEASGSRHRYYNPKKVMQLRRRYSFEQESKKLAALYDRLLGTDQRALGTPHPHANPA